jgi:hypothetical protein
LAATGKRMSIKKQCEARGLSFKTYCSRRYLLEWSHEDALNRPVPGPQKENRMPAPSRFDYVAYDPKSSELSATFKAKFEEVNPYAINLRKARAKSVVLTKMEECFMWVGKSIRDSQLKRNAGKQ